MNIINDFEMGVLGFLKDNPMHGYAIHNQIMKLSDAGIVWNIKQSRLYQMLGKLEENGCVESREIPQKKRPTRRLYEITDIGLSLFNNWKLEPVKHGREFRIIFLLKLFFVMKEGRKESENLFTSQISECQNWVQERDKSGQEIKDKFPYIVSNFRTSQIEHYINWLHWCIEYIRKN